MSEFSKGVVIIVVSVIVGILIIAWAGGLF